MDLQAFFGCRDCIVATMHGKERVIGPLLEAGLGVSVRVPRDFDTDRFGTFTRDVARQGSQIEAARRKAKAALDLSGASLAVASEGSFGPHPVLMGLPANLEIVVLIDLNNDLEIVGQAFSTETNFRHQTITSLEQALAFASEVGFPDHGVVVRGPDGSFQKGITEPERLTEAVRAGLERIDRIQIEADMRAMVNPTRMRNIGRATQDLIDRIRQTCPRCGWPGFDVVEQQAGLPCSGCGMPTSLTRRVIYACRHCHLRLPKLNPEGLVAADPAQCQFCNP